MGPGFSWGGQSGSPWQAGYDDWLAKQQQTPQAQAAQFPHENYQGANAPTTAATAPPTGPQGVANPGMVHPPAVGPGPAWNGIHTAMWARQQAHDPYSAAMAVNAANQQNGGAMGQSGNMSGQTGGASAPPGATGGQWQPFGNSPMVPNVSTSITPGGVFSPEQTQQSINQQRGQLSAQNNLRQLLHGTDTPGVSRSAGSIAAILPQIAQSRGESALLGQAVPFSDAQANAQQTLQGQQAQGNEWLGLVGASNQMNQQALANQYAQQQQLLQILSGLGLFS
jgi:hypothetical protein